MSFGFRFFSSSMYAIWGNAMGWDGMEWGICVLVGTDYTSTNVDSDSTSILLSTLILICNPLLYSACFPLLHSR